MARLSLKQHMSLTVLVVMVVLTLIAFFVVIPRIRAITQIRQTIVERQKQVEQQHSQSRQLRRSLSELSRSLGVAKEVSQATVTPGKELDLIKELESLAEQHNIEQNLNVAVKEISRTSPLYAQKIQSYYELAFLNHGHFEDMIAFLADLETLPFYIIIDNIQWEVHNAREEGHSVSLRFDGKVYIYNP